MECKHEKVHFRGQASLVGSYYCDECDYKINPIVQHARDNRFHVRYNPTRDNLSYMMEECITSDEWHQDHFYHIIRWMLNTGMKQNQEDEELLDKIELN